MALLLFLIAKQSLKTVTVFISSVSWIYFSFENLVLQVKPTRRPSSHVQQKRSSRRDTLVFHTRSHLHCWSSWTIYNLDPRSTQLRKSDWPRLQLPTDSYIADRGLQCRYCQPKADFRHLATQARWTLTGKNSPAIYNNDSNATKWMLFDAKRTGYEESPSNKSCLRRRRSGEICKCTCLSILRPAEKVELVLMDCHCFWFYTPWSRQQLSHQQEEMTLSVMLSVRRVCRQSYRWAS